jgi:hypothetical protein
LLRRRRAEREVEHRAAEELRVLLAARRFTNVGATST